MLLDCGGDVSAHNAQGQTPLQVVAAGRATRERLAQAYALMNSMGVKVPGIDKQLPVEQLLSSITLPTEGWDACERLLKAARRGSRHRTIWTSLFNGHEGVGVGFCHSLSQPSPCAGRGKSSISAQSNASARTP